MVVELLSMAWRVFWLWYTKPQRLKDLAACRKRIDQLERELFPEWFPRPKASDPEAFSFAPGATWLVDDPRQVTMFRSDWIPQAAVSASSAQVVPMNYPQIVAQQHRQIVAQQRRLHMERLALYGLTGSALAAGPLPD